MALNRSDKSRILRRYFPGMTRNSEMSTEPSSTLTNLLTSLSPEFRDPEGGRIPFLDTGREVPRLRADLAKLWKHVPSRPVQ